MGDIGFALGVIAGEGTFTVGIKRVNGRTYLAPYFQLRMDGCDEQLICDCRNTIGEDMGTLRDCSTTCSAAGMFNWRIENKQECLQLVETIETYAPDIWYRSEKGRNFEVWSDIVRIYAGGQTTAKQRVEMAELAKGSLNNNASNAKSDEDWDELIDVFRAQ